MNTAEWIKVTDEIPTVKQDGEVVLAYTVTGSIYIIDTPTEPVVWGGCMFAKCSKMKRDVMLTHWMKLPGKPNRRVVKK